ncbi:oxidoreductases, acting on NADH or NADPH, quinone or similar compound as acceptor [Actinidia rufa]|uniref:Oxidoreductases, acting on NADH or NADPH, quinone or similar compound as acceptor n=1 Tax=Actinidia rufa TaxID=165716 RepID=A0A7J0GRH9_9ERIC|nr:oxidoreductases, acting on NADH or NADPH, quinone or similar compound as acceptor [Actinidia rufa]
MAATTCSYHRSPPLPSTTLQHRWHLLHAMTPTTVAMRRPGLVGGRRNRKRVAVKSERGIWDFIGGDLVKFDLGQWLSDVEKHKALAIYPPHEGGYEGRYLNRLRYQGYQFLDLSARGLGDPETTLTKIHPVCPPHVGKQPIARWYFPPEVDYRLSLLPPNAKGLVVWVIEAKVLSKAELQFLALLPTLRPNVRVIAECGNWRKFMWKPLKDNRRIIHE